jgi:hypothetical protein
MRKTDNQEKQYFRAGARVYCQNGEWFFTTREEDHGPFPTRQAAELNLTRYVTEMEHFDDASGGACKRGIPELQASDLLYKGDEEAK